MTEKRGVGFANVYPTVGAENTRLTFRHPHEAKVGDWVHLSEFRSNANFASATGAVTTGTDAAKLNAPAGVQVALVHDAYTLDVVTTATAQAFWPSLTDDEMTVLAGNADPADGAHDRSIFVKNYAIGYMDTRHSKLYYHGETRSTSQVKHATATGQVRDYANDPQGDEDAVFMYNFEVHAENTSQISGLDTSGSVPLHVTLTTESGTSKTAQACCYLHHDCLLRIGGSSADGQPLGGIISASR